MTSFDVFQVLPDAVEQSAILEMCARPETGGLAAAARRRAGDPARQAFRAVGGDAPPYAGSLRALVERAGFRIERLTYDQFSLLPMMLPVRMWHRLTAKDGVVAAGEGEITVPIAPVNAAADGVGVARSAGAASRRHANRQLADVFGAEVSARAKSQPLAPSLKA